jgi:hypothetical protein
MRVNRVFVGVFDWNAGSTVAQNCHLSAKKWLRGLPDCQAAMTFSPDSVKISKLLTSVVEV